MFQRYSEVHRRRSRSAVATQRPFRRRRSEPTRRGWYC